jgi:hypothetical protein
MCLLNRYITLDPFRKYQHLSHTHANFVTGRAYILSDVTNIVRDALNVRDEDVKYAHVRKHDMNDVL